MSKTEQNPQAVSSKASIPSAGVVLCDLCVSPVGWQPIATVPMGQTVFLGSYYDTFVLRPPFEAIWQVAEGHAFEWEGGVEFSLRGRLEQPPTHWRGLFAPPPYAPSDAQLEIAAQMETRQPADARPEGCAQPEPRP